MPTNSLVTNLSDAELVAMDEGNRLDVKATAPWQLHVFALPFGQTDWRDQGVQHGTRDEMTAAYPTALAGLRMMVALKIIDPGPDGKGSFYLMVLPDKWEPGDVFAFPTLDEVIEERHRRGI